ncbi:MAG: hypothetical protein AAF368_15155 [Planctomycetota bacterium]
MSPDSSQSSVQGRPRRPRFIGESGHTLDGKFRVFVPKRFQKQLSRNEEGQLCCVLAQGMDDCVYLFDEDGFEQAIDQLDTELFTGGRERNTQRAFFSNMAEVGLDASGRILIPENLRGLFGDQREVQMVGVLRRAEIWPAAAWQKLKEDSREDLAKIDEILVQKKDGGAQ